MMAGSMMMTQIAFRKGIVEMVLEQSSADGIDNVETTLSTKMTPIATMHWIHRTSRALL